MTEALARINLASHAPSVPFVRALGAEWLGHDGVGIRMLLPLAPRVCQAAAVGAAGAVAVAGADGAVPCIDLRAVVALLDHAGGAAVYAALPSIATATLELRVDITGAVRAGADIVVGAHVAAIGHGSALAMGQASSAGDEPFLRTSARYIVGSGPGQAPARAGYLAEREAGVARFADVGPSSAGSFDALLGGIWQGADWLLPFTPPLVGSVTLPALHGGVVAAGLMHSIGGAAGGIAPQLPQLPKLQLSGLTVRYLRAAQAAPTTFTAHVVRAGKRAAFIDARAMQGDRLVATAQALFG